MKKLLIISILFFAGCEGPTEPVNKTVVCVTGKKIILGTTCVDNFWIVYEGITKDNTLSFIEGISNNISMHFEVKPDMKQFTTTFKLHYEFLIKIISYDSAKVIIESMGKHH
jgi:hypothetical protein